MLENMEITENSIPNINDLKEWQKDYDYAKEQVHSWLEQCKHISKEEQIEYVISKIHHDNANGICSDVTTEPLEYIDVNYGSITYTIPIYDGQVSEITQYFDGYITRNGIELSDVYCEMTSYEVEKVLCKKFIQDVADKEDLRLNCIEEYYIELEYWSGLDEDCIIALSVPKLTIKEVQHAMYLFVEDFDAEEHATELYNLHGAGGTPTSIRDLLDDADEQAEKLLHIYNTMIKE